MGRGEAVMNRQGDTCKMIMFQYPRSLELLQHSYDCSPLIRCPCFKYDNKLIRE